MQIGELSARTGASVRMLRYYEEQGLLEPRPHRVRLPRLRRVRRGPGARIRCMLSAALPAGVVGKALRFLLDGRADIPEEPAERARLAEALSGELAALTDKIAALQHSRDLLAQIVADVRGAVVGPGSPGDPGHAQLHGGAQGGPCGGLGGADGRPVTRYRTARNGASSASSSFLAAS